MEVLLLVLQLYSVKCVREKCPAPPRLPKIKSVSE
jgi:hypothetical protein